ncbi:hypothetical protein [Methylobacterium nigriterrae]|uniref:hypothetical protein n=1 Tax=Methylobacterium nigriterrae TaxID=3127512 RepID=UPI003013CF89
MNWLHRPAEWPLDAQIALAIALGLCLILAVSLVRSRRYNRLAGEAFVAVSAELERATSTQARATRQQEVSPAISTGPALPTNGEVVAASSSAAQVSVDAVPRQSTATAEVRLPHVEDTRLFGT